MAQSSKESRTAGAVPEATPFSSEGRMTLTEMSVLRATDARAAAPKQTKTRPYKRPVCHCGHELVLFEEYVNEMCKAITEQGKIGSTLKRGFFKNEPRQTLRCLKCRNYYDVKFDEQRRIVRGRKHSQRQLHR